MGPGGGRIWFQDNDFTQVARARPRWHNESVSDIRTTAGSATTKQMRTQMPRRISGAGASPRPRQTTDQARRPAWTHRRNPGRGISAYQRGGRHRRPAQRALCLYRIRAKNANGIGPRSNFARIDKYRSTKTARR